MSWRGAHGRVDGVDPSTVDGATATTGINGNSWVGGDLAACVGPPAASSATWAGERRRPQLQGRVDGVDRRADCVDQDARGRSSASTRARRAGRQRRPLGGRGRPKGIDG